MPILIVNLEFELLTGIPAGDVEAKPWGALPDTSISGRRVARELTALIKQRGKPGMIVSDNVLRAEGNGADCQSLSVRQHALAA